MDWLARLISIPINTIFVPGKPAAHNSIRFDMFRRIFVTVAKCSGAHSFKFYKPSRLDEPEAGRQKIMRTLDGGADIRPTPGQYINEPLGGRPQCWVQLQRKLIGDLNPDQRKRNTIPIGPIQSPAVTRSSGVGTRQYCSSSNL